MVREFLSITPGMSFFQNFLEEYTEHSEIDCQVTLRKLSPWTPILYSSSLGFSIAICLFNLMFIIY